MPRPGDKGRLHWDWTPELHLKFLGGKGCQVGQIFMATEIPRIMPRVLPISVYWIENPGKHKQILPRGLENVESEGMLHKGTEILCLNWVPGVSGESF
jgi:hypothetical protein